MKLLLAFSLLVSSAFASLNAQTPATPSVIKIESQSKWNGYNRDHFAIEGKSAWVTIPNEPAPGNPWIWRARFPGFHDEIDKEMLKRGYFVAHVNTENMYGSPEAMRIWDKMYQAAVKQYKLNPKVVLVGVSRGGLFVYNFANNFPERVAVIYGDTPVMDFTTWPEGKNGTGTRSEGDWNNLKKNYGFKDDATAEASPLKPMNYGEKLAKNHIPIFHVIGPTDKIVPPEFNSLKFKESYPYRMVIHANKGPYSLEGHHFPLDNVQGSCNFMENNTPLPALKKEKDWIMPRNGISNAITKMEKGEKVRVLFLGGSITENPGWQNMTMDYFKQRFPKAQFEFKNVGIGSHCSPIHAFRWREHFSGPADLVFFEAAVNDLHNSRTPDEQQRAYEGTIRGIKKDNPTCDIVCLHFAEPRYNQAYQKGETPDIIKRHDAIAAHYKLPSLNLAKEVADRLAAGQFNWGKHFRDLHPSQFGQRLYFQALTRFYDSQVASKVKTKKLPAPMIKNTWEDGRFLPLEKAYDLNGFSIDPKWSAKKGTGEQRAGYYNCPMLITDTEGSSFKVDFEGTAFGLFITAGYDTAAIEWQVDGGPWKTKDTFSPWSKNLHLPFAFILEPELKRGKHTITIRVKKVDDRSALRIRYILVN